MEWWGGLLPHPRVGTKSVAPWVLHLLHVPGSSSDSGSCLSSHPPGVGTRSMTPQRTTVWNRLWCPLSRVTCVDRTAHTGPAARCAASNPLVSRR